jgi:hypothetical protein
MNQGMYVADLSLIGMSALSEVLTLYDPIKPIWSSLPPSDFQLAQNPSPLPPLPPPPPPPPPTSPPTKLHDNDTSRADVTGVPAYLESDNDRAPALGEGGIWGHRSGVGDSGPISEFGSEGEMNVFYDGEKRLGGEGQGGSSEADIRGKRAEAEGGSECGKSEWSP